MSCDKHFEIEKLDLNENLWLSLYLQMQIL